MAKTKTSKKPAAFSLDEMKLVRLADGIESKRHNPKDNLSDLDFISRALCDCILECDERAFKSLIRSYYEATNTSTALEKAGVGASTYYDAVKPEGNPSLKTVFKLMRGIIETAAHVPKKARA